MAAKKAELKARLTLNNVQFVRTIKSSIAYAKDLAKQFARAPIQTTFVAGILSARKAVQTTASATEMLGRTIRKSLTIGAVGAAALATSVLLIGKGAIDTAANLETFTTSFEVILGSATKAKQRMKEIVDFSNRTNFLVPEIAAASQTLEVLTRGALSGVKGLTMVGDTASGLNESFEDTAVVIGRMFDAIRSGRSAGQELAWLRDRGGISSNSARKIEALTAAQATAEAWKLAQQELGRFDGMMGKRSKTWAGLMTRFHEAFQEVQRQVGGPLIDALKPVLFLAVKATFALAHNLETGAAKFKDGIKAGADFLLGAFSDPAATVGVFTSALKAGIAEAGNLLVASFEAGVRTIADGKLLSGFADAFRGVAKIISGHLMKAFQEPIAYLIASTQAAIEAVSNPKQFAQREAILVKRDAAKTNINKFNPDGSGLPGLFGTPFMKLSPEELKSRQDDARKELAEANRELKDFDSKHGTGSVKSRAAAYMKDGTVGGMASSAITGGREELQKGVKGMMGAIGEGLAKLEVKDVFGAGSEWEKTKTKFRAAAAQGAKKAAALASETAAIASPMDMQRLAHRSLNGGLNSRGGGVGGGGLRGGGLFGAGVRTTHLIGFRERRELESQQVAAQQASGDRGARAGLAPGGFGAVRRGDRRRMQEVQRERLREKMGIDKTNAILESIQKTFDSMVKS